LLDKRRSNAFYSGNAAFFLGFVPFLGIVVSFLEIVPLMDTKSEINGRETRA
jgi:hypothetical protein